MAAPHTVAQDLSMRTASQAQVFHREHKNPIITARDLPFRAAAVLNPGAAICDGKTVLLIRVEDVAGYSSIYVARSDNGVDCWKIEPEPLMSFAESRWTYEEFGCEDPRITYVPDEDKWYITYVAYSSAGPAVGIASTKDFTSVERISLLGSTDDKDGVLFPRKFDGRWAILHRPDAGGQQHIWSAYSPDLVHWGEPHCVLRQESGPAWDGAKVGAGPPPIRTDRGWMILYHGVKMYGGNPLYRAGLALLDLEKPHKVVARYAGSVFQAEAPYELSGFVPNVIFPTGALVRDDEVWVYYGAADTYICLARAKMKDLLDLLDDGGQ